MRHVSRAIGFDEEYIPPKYTYGLLLAVTVL